MGVMGGEDCTVEDLMVRCFITCFPLIILYFLIVIRANITLGAEYVCLDVYFPSTLMILGDW